MAQIIAKEGGEDSLSRPGVAIFLLKIGATVPAKNIKEARQKLVEEKCEETYPNDSKERKEIVKDEIEIMDYALANDGSVPGQPIGVRPIMHSRWLSPQPWNIGRREPMVNVEALCDFCGDKDCKYLDVTGRQEPDCIGFWMYLVPKGPNPSFGFAKKTVARRCVVSHSVNEAYRQFKYELAVKQLAEEISTTNDGADKGMSPEGDALLDKFIREAAPKWKTGSLCPYCKAEECSFTEIQGNGVRQCIFSGPVQDEIKAFSDEMGRKLRAGHSMRKGEPFVLMEDRMKASALKWRAQEAEKKRSTMTD